MSALGLNEIAPGVILRPMLTLDDAIDLFDGDLARRGRTDRTRELYAQVLYKFSDRFPRMTDVAKVTQGDCERFLDQWNGKPDMQARAYDALNGLYAFLWRTQRVRRNPLEFTLRPRRPSETQRDVVTVSSVEVRRMLAAVETWPERIGLQLLAYLGPRRSAAALLRLSDWNRETGHLRFREKGGQMIWKPLPRRLATQLRWAERQGVWADGGPDPYLIPSPGTPRNPERDTRFLYEIARGVAARLGIRAHTHALRAAFITHYLEENGRDTIGAQALAGHTRIATTERYWRKLSRERAMEPVRGLSWTAPKSEGPSDFTLDNTLAAEVRKLHTSRERETA